MTTEVFMHSTTLDKSNTGNPAYLRLNNQHPYFTRSKVAASRSKRTLTDDTLSPPAKRSRLDTRFSSSISKGNRYSPILNNPPIHCANSNSIDNESLVILDSINIDMFKSAPMVKLLSIYNSIILSKLLDNIKHDYENKTPHSWHAEQITAYLVSIKKQEKLSIFKQFMKLGTGACAMKIKYPLLDQFVTDVGVINYEHSNVKTELVMEALFRHAKTHPGTESHKLVSNLFKAELPTVESAFLPNNTADEESSDSVNTCKKQKSLSGNQKTRSKTAAACKAAFVFSTPYVSGSEPLKPTDTSGALNNGTRCTQGEFACENGDCLTLDKVCDQRYDCGPVDISDEALRNCHVHCHKDNRFPCSSIPKCILKKHMCDGDFNCEDGSDESRPPCPCLESEVLCQDKSLCITKDKICDEHRDCGDASDESADACKPSVEAYIYESLNKIPGDKLNLQDVYCAKQASHTEILNNHGITRLSCQNITSSSKKPYNCEYICNRQPSFDRSVLWCPSKEKYGRCIRDQKPLPQKKRGHPTSTTSNLCDGRNDCLNGEDEAPDLCYHRCNLDAFPCGDGTCKQLTSLCDDYLHCLNNKRDEDLFTCMKERENSYINNKCASSYNFGFENCKSHTRKFGCEAVKNFQENTTTTSVSTLDAKSDNFDMSQNSSPTCTSINTTTPANIQQTNIGNDTSIRPNIADCLSINGLVLGIGVAGWTILGVIALGTLYKKVIYMRKFPGGLRIRDNTYNV